MDEISSISEVNMFEVPLRALRPNTRALLSSLLNTAKLIPSEEGLPRDWRGLLQLSGLSGTVLCNSPDPTAQILCIWEKLDPNGTGPKPCIGVLQSFLGQLDRWDAYDDTVEMMITDAKEYTSRSSQVCPLVPELNKEADGHILTRDDVVRFRLGLPAQNYDAFLLYAEEDEAFASEMVERLEKDYGLKLCVRDRDLIGGLTFEHEAIMKLISDRCNRLIVVLSPNFLRSDANKFFVMFAQALGIEFEHRGGVFSSYKLKTVRSKIPRKKKVVRLFLFSEQRERKVVPCLYQRCQLPLELGYCFLLDYNRSSRLWNFWEKLRDSIQTSTAENASSQPALPHASRINRCIVEEVKDAEEQHPAEKLHKDETALVCLSDPETLYPSGPSATEKGSHQWVPVKNSNPQSLSQELQVPQISVAKPKSPTNFLRKLLPKELTPSIAPLDSSKPKKKWFAKKKRNKAVALENS